MTITQKIKKDNFGAVNTSNEKAKDGYWIFKFTANKAYTDQQTGNLMCKGRYWWQVGVGKDP